MAATTYTALVSLINVLNRIQHPGCPVLFENKSQIQSLFDKVSFLLDFLEKNDAQRSTKLTEGLGRQIADAAYATEDLIEFFIVQQILAMSSPISPFSRYTRKVLQEIYFINKLVMKMEQRKRDSAYALFYQDLQKIIQELDFIMEEVIKIKKGFENDQLPKCPTISVGSTPTTPIGKSNIMVGFDEDLIRLMDTLTTNQSSRQIIPIVGMGGIGKTTLALNVHNHPYVVNNFHVRACVTISQDYSVREIIRCLLRDIGVDVDCDELRQMDMEEVGVQLYKCLFGRKYLITLDDVWSTVAWDDIRRFFPDNSNGSRFLLTTRLSNVALSVGSCTPFEMRFLDDGEAWDLLSQNVFGKEVCPLELEKFGKAIAKSCKGLPLAVVVIGGLLRMSYKTREYWEDMAGNITSIKNAENDENFLKILALSYNHLPIHLKPCFLYMANFPEDFKIRTSRLIRLWVADGFLKKNTNKSLEEVALEYLNDLVDRNLIMVREKGCSGKIKTCMIHDSLRDFCLREAQRESFLCVVKDDLPQRTNNERRFVVHQSTKKVPSLSSCARSLVYNDELISPSFASRCMLRVLSGIRQYSFSGVLKLINSRYLQLSYIGYGFTKSNITLSISLLWNLETLIVDTQYPGHTFSLPSEIWKLPHLRHLMFDSRLILSDPVGEPNSCNPPSNLQTLSTIRNFSFSDEVLNIIPNLKKLAVFYDVKTVTKDVSLTHCFNNLVHLHKLEKLKCLFAPSVSDYYLNVNRSVFDEPETLTLSHNLKKLTLSFSRIPWKNMTIVGSLPNLEALKLNFAAFYGEEWHSIEGEFGRLKYLSLHMCSPITWKSDNSHFPRLEHLDLSQVRKLKEIPCGIGEVESLKLIRLYGFSESLLISAKQILEERQDMGNDDLLIQAYCKKSSEMAKKEMHNSTNDKFEVIITDGSVHWTPKDAVWE